MGGLKWTYGIIDGTTSDNIGENSLYLDIMIGIKSIVVNLTTYQHILQYPLMSSLVVQEWFVELNQSPQSLYQELLYGRVVYSLATERERERDYDRVSLVFSCKWQHEYMKGK